MAPEEHICAAAAGLPSRQLYTGEVQGTPMHADTAC